MTPSQKKVLSFLSKFSEVSMMGIMESCNLASATASAATLCLINAGCVERSNYRNDYRYSITWHGRVELARLAKEDARPKQEALTSSEMKVFEAIEDMNGAATVPSIKDATKLSDASVKRGVLKLRKMGLIANIREGNRSYYELMQKSETS
jgi:DNA-binding MarR family transcriptional regulator